MDETFKNILMKDYMVNSSQMTSNRFNEWNILDHIEKSLACTLM